MEVTYIRKFLIIPFIILILTGCGKQKYKIDITGQILKNSLIEIYSFNENEKVYSMFTEINYLVDKKNKIPLEEALEKKLITMEEIVSQMKVISARNDGGSLIYEYSVSSGNNLSNQDFILVKCNSLEINGGIKNIYIGNDEKLIDHCTI